MEISEFCTSMSGMLRLVGWILTIFKFAIPLIIIAMGMFDFGKAVVAEKEDEIKKQTKRLIYRVVAGIVIFFVPSIIFFVFQQVGGYDRDTLKTCENCLLYPATKCTVSNNN